MTTAEFVAYLRRLDVKLSADGDRLHCSAPKGVLTPELRAELAKRKPELMPFLQATEGAARPGAPVLQPIPRDGNLPLSFVQERMWLSDQLVPDNSGANAPGAIRLTGPVDVAALQQSLDEMVRRHEILRTTFPSVDGRPVQVIAPPSALTMPVVDLSALPASERETELRRLAAEEAQRPFDLSRGPLFRVTLLRLSGRDHVILMNMPHIVCDGWSLGVVVREMATLYHAFSTGLPLPLPELPIQYADFAAWQRQWLQGEELETGLGYWKRQLGGHMPVLELPTDRPRPAAPTFRGATQRFALPAQLCERLKELSQRHGVTLFMTLLAGFKALLARYTGQEDIVLGSPIAGRTRVETEGLIGCFMNPLVLRTDLSGDPTFRELLGRVREVCLGAYAHQHLPFEMLVKALRPKVDLSHMPLFQVLFNLQHAAPIPVMKLPGLTMSPLELDSQVSAFDMTLDMWVARDEIVGVLEYRVDLFDASTITRMLGHFHTVLERIVAGPDERLSSLPVFGEELGDHDVDKRVSDLSPEKRELLELLLREEGVEASPSSIVARRSEANTIPLSFGQQRLWVFDQLEPGNPVYNVPCAFHLTGPLDAAALERALNEIVRRHEILRTTFTGAEGPPVQIIAPTLSVAMPVVDLAPLPEDERHAAARRLAGEEAQRSFDLSRGPLLRVTLLRLGGEEHVLLMTMSHIVCDGWSIGVLMGELAVLYEAFSAGRSSPLPELPIQYRDFAVWQRQWLQGKVLAGQLAYWRQRLGGRLPVLELPADRARPAVMTFHGALQSFALPATLAESLKELSRREGVTLFMALLAVFKALLFRYTGQDDILVDSSIAGRERAETRELIGFFVNELVLRTDLSGRPTFRELLGRVREVCLGAYAHQDVPFEKLVEELQPERDLSRTPLVQVSFNVLENLGRPLGLSGGLTLRPAELDTGRAKFDLTLHIWEDVAGLKGSLEYSTDLFDRATIARLLGHFQTMLESIVADPEQGIGDVSMMPADERRQLSEWNDTRTECQPEECLQQLFEAQVARTPEAVAVARASGPEEGGELTYRELNRGANQLAHHLRSLGVGPEVRVGLCVERSLAMVVGMLGILKAGGAYVPLDPSYPQDRLAFMLADAQVAVLVTHGPSQQQGQAWLEAEGGVEAGRRVVCLEADGEKIARESVANPIRAARAANAAYVIYTSGSTGRPKGVVVTHGGVINHNLAVARGFGLQADDRVLQFHSLSFDAAVEELFPTWFSGATVVLRPWEVPGPGEELQRLVDRDRLTVLNLPTAYWHAWVEELAQSTEQLPASLRAVIVGGQKASSERFGVWRKRVGTAVRWINTYGPTETTIISTVHEPALEADGAELPIGRPIANTQIYLLDGHLHPVPIGVPGELHIGGVGVARGYLNRPELTAERFIPDPVGATVGGRLYKTGDLARYRADGALEFLGRIDEQVKIRGYRIEPGEIETVLAGHPGVRAAVVMAREDVPGDPRLVAYLVTEGDPTATISALRDSLKEQLPSYMRPSAFLTLDALPLTPSGKVDRHALPAPDATRPELEAPFVAPGTEVEKKVAAIWTEVLGLDRVSVHDNFFEVGGHSLLATQLVSRLRRTFQVELPLRSFFEKPTVLGLAESIEGAHLEEPSSRAPRLQPVPRDGELPLSFAEERMWFAEQLAPGSTGYNEPAIVRVSGSLDAAALERTLDRIVQRHEVFRTTFGSVEGRPVRRIAPTLALTLPVVDLSALPTSEREAEVMRLGAEEAQRPFDLARGPLFRVTLLRLGEQEHVLVMHMPHIVYDGWSLGVFVRELAVLYQAFSTGQPSSLPELPIQYADFAAWQRQWLQGEELETRLGYWKRQLGGHLPVLELPTDRPRPAVLTFRGATQRFTLPAQLCERLKELSQRHGVTLFMTLLAGFKALLARYTGQEDIVLGSPIAGRTRVETEGLIGCFMNPLVLRTDLSGDPTFRELLGRVREVCLGAYAHQDLPFDVVVQALRPKRSLSHMPMFQALFILQNAPLEVTELPGLSLSRLAVDGHVSAFDLTLTMWEAGQEIGGSLEYKADLFDSTTIERMLGHFQTMLERVVGDPEQRVSDVPIMPSEERQQMLVEWNETRTEHAQERCLQHLFEAQVERTPETVAVVCPGAPGDCRHLTYRELNRRANQLAHHLRSLGVGPEVRVGLCVERSLAMVVGVLGILKAGGSYVPLDPAYPAERLAYMLGDAQVSVLVTHGPSARQSQAWLEGASAESGRRVVCLDGDGDRIAEASETNPDSGATAGNVAYVIYTSGSTGLPKGVLVAHRGVVNHNLAVARAFGLRAADRVLQFHSLSFDAAVEELFPTWFSGATVVLRAAEVPGPGAELRRLIESEQLTVLNLPTAYWHAWVEELAPPTATIPESLRAVIVGGEKAAADHFRTWRRRAGTKVRWINTYGPTEATVIATLHEPGAEDEDGEVPIGRPIANTRIYLLDRHLQPVPIGVAGELHIGGVGVARGYLNRPELTAEKFIPDPVGGAAGERLYKTGDLARYRADGALEYLGRVDEQVKIRGFRIEPGEIEAMLAGHPGVRAVVVVAREDTPGDTRLVAYVVPGPDASPDVDELRSYAQKALPAYMVPSAFLLVGELPYTTSGKVDRGALPSPTGTRPDLREAYVGPRSPVEQELTQIWSDVLGLERVGVHDNFFDLGGYSLLATRVISRVRTALEVDVPLRALFENPTIAGLSQAVEFSRATGGPQAEDVPDLAGEAILDPEITAAGRMFEPVTEPASILLTGATGFLGPFLLHELLQQTRADIYCLVRSDSPESGKQRLESELASYSLLDEATRSRIIPVPGDLSRPLLGLSTEQFEELARRIDVIYHNGALVNGLYPYSALKATNVLGTQDVLRLASRGNVKPIHYVSTMSVFPFSRYSGGVIREDDPLDSPEGVHGGYAQSKWVAEKLMTIGRSRGIPASIYRPGWITGHSQTGASKTNDPFHHLLASWIELGSVPRRIAGLRVDMTPVDYVSQAIVQLSRQAESLGKAYHLVNPHPIAFGELTDWMQSFGYPLRYVSLGRWVQEWIDRARESQSPLLAPLLHLAPEITSSLDRSDETTTFVMPRLDCQGTLDALRDSTIECPPVDAEFLRRYFAYFIRSGLLAAPSARDARAYDSR